MPVVERYNPDTDKFEFIDNMSEETMVEVLGVFDAEAKIVGRDMETRAWMDNIRGVPHIQYD